MILDQQVDYPLDQQVDHSSPERGIPHQSGKKTCRRVERLGPHPSYKSFPSYTHHAMDHISTQKYYLSTNPYTPHTISNSQQNHYMPICGLPLGPVVDFPSPDLWTTPLPTCGLPLYQPVDYLSSQCKANSPNPYIPSNILVYRWTTTLPTCGLPLSQPMDSLSAQWWTTPRPSIAPLLI